MKAYEATLTIDGKYTAGETGPNIDIVLDDIVNLYFGLDKSKKPKEIKIEVKEI